MLRSLATEESALPVTKKPFTMKKNKKRGEFAGDVSMLTEVQILPAAPSPFSLNEEFSAFKVKKGAG